MTSIPSRVQRKGIPSNIMGVSPGVALILSIYLTITMFMSVSLPFPWQFDELQHLSMIRSEADHPTLFPEYERQHVLQEDTEHWSPTKNHINHPSLYYLALAPVVRLGGGVLLIRFLNAGLSFLALVIAVRAGCRILPNDPDRTVFAVLAASFPKGAEIGGLINNDNLAALAGSLVFAGLASDALSVWMIAGGLALAGWSKLTALIGLGALALAAYAGMIWTNRLRFSFGRLLPILAGLTLGAIPYLWSLLESGHLLYVSRETYYTPPDHRPALTFMTFAAKFFGTLAVKWPAAEGSLPLWLALPFFLFPFAVAGFGMRHMGADKRIAEPYAIALIVLAAIHLAFGWHAFKDMGDLTIAQTRYYNVLWPGIALAGTVGIMALARTRRMMRGLLLGLYLWPTALGGLILAFAVHAA